MSQHVVYLSLGSNLGHKEQNIRTAIKKIRELIGDVVRQSTLYVTAPWGFQSSNSFVNAAICCHTALAPMEVLRLTQQIEQAMGRKEKSCNGIYHDRIIDIDILLYDHLTLDTPQLKIPHPLMQERDFVKVPLREILDTELSAHT